MFERLSDLREAFMPEIIQISDAGMTLGRKPLRSMRTAVKILELPSSAVQRASKSVRTASMKRAVYGIRLALIALANRRFEEAGNIAINSAIEAAAAFRQNPEMGARIFATARGVVRSAILWYATPYVESRRRLS
jgi:hypothetical protein